MSTFALDPTHSQVEFVARHMVFSKVRGSFGSFRVQLEVDDSTNLPTSISAEIDAGSIDTKVGDRDAHLRSADFLDAENYKALTFKSTRIQGSGQHFTAEGELTIRGTTKPVTLNGTFDGRGKDPWGNDRIAYSAETTINRKEFGLNWNQALETGGVLVGENVEIILSIQAVKAQQPAAV